MRTFAPKIVNPTFIRDKASSAKDAVGDVAKGYRRVGVSDGRFSLVDMIVEICGQIGPSDVYVSTWTASTEDVKYSARMMSRGSINSLTLLVDRSVMRLRGGDIEEIMGKVNGRIVYSRTHAKFAVVRSPELSVVIRTSMNLNRNKRLEQFDIDESAEMADFFIDVILSEEAGALMAAPKKQNSLLTDSLCDGLDLDIDLGFDLDELF